MSTRSDDQHAWFPQEILVRVVEGDEEAFLAGAMLRQPEAGVYAPSFSLWEGAPVLALLFKATDAPKPKGRPAPVLFLNLHLPKDDSPEYLL
jgi:hypothetical protein